MKYGEKHFKYCVEQLNNFSIENSIARDWRDFESVIRYVTGPNLQYDATESNTMVQFYFFFRYGTPFSLS